jgi:hypothetical protein
VFGPAPVPDVPYAVVVVELDEGPRILGVGAAPPADQWAIGRRVGLEVRPAGDTFAIFAVHPDEA